MVQNSVTENTVTNQAAEDVAMAVTKAQRRTAVTILLFLYILNYLDRQIINILAEPIKQELALADWQLGLLTGLAFAVFYALAGIPIARLAEHSNRRNIIGVATAIWSVFTMLCGIANSYLQMLLFRFGVGVGEAGLVPPAHSLIADIYPKNKRASAMAIFQLGLPIGGLTGLIFGGIVADLAGWRMAFILAGLPGIILTFLVFIFLTEPRTQLQNFIKKNGEATSFAQVFKCLLAKPSFILGTAAAVCISITVYSHQAFSPAFFFRAHGADLTAMASNYGLEAASFLGIAFGLIMGFGGGLGVWLSGKIADKVSYGDLRNYCIVPAISLGLFVPIQIAAFVTEDLVVCLLLFIPSIFLASSWFAPLFALIQSIAPKNMRSTASAIVLLSINLLGLGLGPVLLGVISDLFVHQAEFTSATALKWALVIMTSFALVASICFYFTRKHVVNDLEG